MKREGPSNTSTAKEITGIFTISPKTAAVLAEYGTPVTLVNLLSASQAHLWVTISATSTFDRGRNAQSLGPPCCSARRAVPASIVLLRAGVAPCVLTWTLCVNCGGKGAREANLGQETVPAMLGCRGRPGERERQSTTKAGTMNARTAFLARSGMASAPELQCTWGHQDLSWA
mmetsp:Transcript_121180/g.354182  ORF Transcript_121180/g.354182 Transcript_121180/m.354182 type:complete len:173 (-) Transcript_121180:15-533(-)